MVGPVAETLTASGPDAAAAAFHRLAGAEPVEFALDDDQFVNAVWGAMELHRTRMVWPLLRLWTVLRPDSSTALTMTRLGPSGRRGPQLAKSLLRRALGLDPDNDEAALS